MNHIGALLGRSRWHSGAANSGCRRLSGGVFSTERARPRELFRCQSQTRGNGILFDISLDSPKLRFRSHEIRVGRNPSADRATLAKRTRQAVVQTEGHKYWMADNVPVRQASLIGSHLWGCGFRIRKLSEKTRRLKGGGSQDWLPHKAAAFLASGLFHRRGGIDRAQPAVTVGPRAVDHANAECKHKQPAPEPQPEAAT